MSSATRAFDLEDDVEGTDGQGGDLEAAIAASRQRAQAKSLQELQLELEAARMRLLRRSQIIDALRKAYVRDVVIIKNELARKSTMNDKEYAAQGGAGTDITDAVPSLDMRPVLALFSPEDAFLRVKSCGECGGHLEIVTRETKHVVRLTKRISALTAHMEEGAKETAQLRAELVLTRQRLKELDERNNDNRDTLVAKLEKTQKTCESNVLALREEAVRVERALQTKLVHKDEALEVVPVLKREVEKLRLGLSEEVTGREEDLHAKDGEIATLKAKMENLAASADANASVLLEVRNKAEDTQRRLKAEKSDHAATRGLLDEERTRYERCRASLETSQEHLADLNERFNELRAEVEAAAEDAQEEAGDANDALASAKAEIKRLRTVLGTNDTATALEASTLKVSAMSEEFNAARLEARDANEALREAQERVKVLQEELEQLQLAGPPRTERKSTMESSSGGLSWHGSFVEPFNEEEDLNERSDRMSSAMMPGGSQFEKGKWAVEKWVALIRFRKAVDAHNTEETRLRHLLLQAQGEEDRERLTSQLESVSNRKSLVGMEDALHKEVAVLKHAAGQSSQNIMLEGEGKSGGGGGAEWEDKMAQEKKDLEDAYKAKLAEAESAYEMAVKALQSELAKYKDDLSALEEEAADMREKLKKVAKQEKHEKGHNAMTEELKKMEEETGISVGFESSNEDASVVGDLSPEDEARLIEDLENAREEIKSIKIRQAMVTHELLGTIKGANAEVEMLRAQLAQMTAERDERVDIKTLAGMGGGMSGAEAEDFESLKEEHKRQKNANANLKKELQESSEALRALLTGLFKGCKETRRAKAKVWNTRDLDRARSIPPPVPPTITGENGNRNKTSAAIKRLSDAGTARRLSSGSSKTNLLKNSDPPKGREEGGGNKREGSEVGGGAVDDGKAELERRREERAAQALEKQRQAEADKEELQDLKEACLFPQSDGVTFAAERLEAAQADVKEQFKVVFAELKEALEMHKKFVLRSRVEARDRVARTASLEAEAERFLKLLKSTEDELHKRSAMLKQTEANLNNANRTVAGLRKGLAAAEADAKNNLFFKEKNAVLQNNLDQAEIFSRGEKKECFKAKWELQEQASTVLELRKQAEEAGAREVKLKADDQESQARIESLRTMLEESEGKLDAMEQQRKSRLESLTATASQVCAAEMGLERSASTQTAFHCPQLTLRRSNTQGTFPARASSSDAASSSRFSPTEGVNWGGAGGDPTAGIVYPAVDARAVAAERDLYSPGVGSAALRETQSFGSLRSATTPDNSLSLMQLSYSSSEGAAVDACPGSAGYTTAVKGAAAQCPRVRAANRETSGPSSPEASHWGLWNEATCPAGLDTANRQQGGGFSAEISTAPTGAVSNSQQHVLEEGKKRPQTSPELVPVGVSRLSESERLEAGEDARNPPRRMHSRLFLQSEMDLSYASREFAAETCAEGNPQVQGHSVSFASLPAGILSSATETAGRGVAATAAARPATISTVADGREGCCRCTNRFLGYSGTVPWNRPKSVPVGTIAVEEMRKQVIDSGIHWETPIPTVWDERRMAMATAAATGQTVRPSRGGTRPGRGGAGVAGVVSRSGVVVDGRLSKTRNLLRSDVLDAVERAKLPLLQ